VTVRVVETPAPEPVIAPVVIAPVVPEPEPIDVAESDDILGDLLK
jgi:hypothetical protein